MYTGVCYVSAGIFILVKSGLKCDLKCFLRSKHLFYVAFDYNAFSLFSAFQVINALPHHNKINNRNIRFLSGFENKSLKFTWNILLPQPQGITCTHLSVYLCYLFFVQFHYLCYKWSSPVFEVIYIFLNFHYGFRVCLIIAFIPISNHNFLNLVVQDAKFFFVCLTSFYHNYE